MTESNATRKREGEKPEGEYPEKLNPLKLNPLKELENTEDVMKEFFKKLNNLNPANDNEVNKIAEQAEEQLKSLEELEQESENTIRTAKNQNKKGKKLARNLKKKKKKIKKFEKLNNFSAKTLLSLVETLHSEGLLTTERLKQFLKVKDKFKTLLYKARDSDTIFHFRITDAKVAPDGKAEIFLEVLHDWVTIDQGIKKMLEEAAIKKQDLISKKPIPAKEFIDYLDDIASKRSEKIIKGEILGATITSDVGHVKIDDFVKKKIHGRGFLHFQGFDGLWMPVDKGMKTKQSLHYALKLSRDNKIKELDENLKRVKPFGIDSLGKLAEEGEKWKTEQMKSFADFDKYLKNNIDYYRIIIRYFVKR